MTRLQLIFAFAAIALAACDRQAKHASLVDRPPARTHIETSIELPGGQGVVHVLAMPTGYMEIARCVIVTSRDNGPAVSCTPKDIDLPPDKD